LSEYNVSIILIERDWKFGELQESSLKMTSSTKSILKCIQDIIRKDLEGIAIITPGCQENLREVTAILTGPKETPYEGGEFVCRLSLTNAFPKEPPKAHFITKIFHPNVEPRTGEVCVNTLKSDWKSSLGLDHVLLTIRCLLINPNAESALNEEAGKLLLDDFQEFSSRAKLMTSIYAQSSKENIDQSAATASSAGVPPTSTSNQSSSKSSGLKPSAGSSASAKRTGATKKKKNNLKRL